MKEIIEELLYEEESATLDFKSEQYKFIGVSDPEKSELLKDILAFANAWRRTDAYILIGIKENKGSRAEVVGIADHIDDAQLQQFVNKKTQRPIDFRYIPMEFEGKQIGVIKIGPQIRPVYLQKDFVPLKRNCIYIRRGSSTDEALPDEIAKMGDPTGVVYSKEPKLVWGFADPKNNKEMGQTINIKNVNLNMPSDLPDYGVQALKINQMLSFKQPDFMKNKDYYRELASFYQKRYYFAPVAFYLFNDSPTVATDVNIEMICTNPKNVMDIIEYDEMPTKPSEMSYGISGIRPIAFAQNRKVHVKRVGVDWSITIAMGKVQPKQTILCSENIYIGSLVNFSTTIATTIFSDNLSEPSKLDLNLNIEVENKSISVEQILELAK